MALFDKFYQEAAAYSQSHKVDMVKIVPPSEKPMFNSAILIQNIDNIDKMDDAQLMRFINDNFDSILNNVFNGTEITKHINCFKDRRFIDAFVQVLEHRQFFNKDQVIHINTICYHYLTISHDMQDSYIVDKMMRMSGIVNRSGLPRLLGLGLSPSLASMLLIARYSDTNLATVIRRVDFIIITQPVEIMTQRMIVEIFRILYDVMREWYRVFPQYMLDVLPSYKENDETTYWVTDEIAEVDSVMNLAALEILDNLPTELIRATLLNYAEGYSIVASGKNTRFSMRCLSDDYYRINAVIVQLDSEGVFVP